MKAAILSAVESHSFRYCIRVTMDPSILTAFLRRIPYVLWSISFRADGSSTQMVDKSAPRKAKATLLEQQQQAVIICVHKSTGNFDPMFFRTRDCSLQRRRSRVPSYQCRRK